MKVYKFKYSDGRRDRRESSDCSVRSLALACSFSYAHYLLKASGRKRNSGVDTAQFEKALKFSNMDFEKLICKITPEQFMYDNPKGRFVLNMAGHFSTVIDGYMYDTNSHFGKLIYSAYKINF